MRKLLLSILVICSINLWATEKEVPSKIEQVTVFRNGAQVIRKANTNISGGSSVIKFTGISTGMNPQTIQLSGWGAFTILSVNHQINYFQEPAETEETKKLRTDRENLTDQVQYEQALLQVYVEEENMILANKVIGGQQSGVNIDDLKANAEFYRTRLTEIKLKKLELQKKINTLNAQVQQLDQQLNQINASRKTISTSEVLVAISAKADTKASFELSYLVNNASWVPAYDLRVKDISSPVELDYRAKINQNSGEDWKGVKLTLSTGNPFQSATKPELSPWWLRFYAPIYASNTRSKKLEMAKDAPASYSEDLEEVAVSPDVLLVEKTTTMEFQIEERYAILANGKPYGVKVKGYSLPASYEYYVAPKLDTDAFLTAQVTDWEQYNLLSGEASLYFEGTYIGKSYLNVNELNDTLALSLGRDKSIVVTRTKQKQFTDKQFIGSKKKQTIGWTIELRNKKKQNVSIVVVDQFPLSTTEDIEVTLDAHKGAKVDEISGKLTWKLDLKPGNKKELNFHYTVKYPKKRKLSLE